MKKKLYNIAIIGLGNIGTYLFNFLNKNKVYISNKNNASFKIVYVSARNRKKKEISKLKRINGLTIINKFLKRRTLIL